MGQLARRSSGVEPFPNPQLRGTGRRLGDEGTSCSSDSRAARCHWRRGGLVVSRRVMHPARARGRCPGRHRPSRSALSDEALAEARGPVATPLQGPRCCSSAHVFHWSLSRKCSAPRPGHRRPSGTGRPLGGGKSPATGGDCRTRQYGAFGLQLPAVSPRCPPLGFEGQRGRSCRADSSATPTPSTCRGDRIRTCDPLVPNQVLYQAEPLPGRRTASQPPTLRRRPAGGDLVADAGTPRQRRDGKRPVCARGKARVLATCLRGSPSRAVRSRAGARADAVVAAPAGHRRRPLGRFARWTLR